MLYEDKTIETIPVGPLGLIPLKSWAAVSYTHLIYTEVSLKRKKEVLLNYNGRNFINLPVPQVSRLRLTRMISTKFTK